MKSTEFWTRIGGATFVALILVAVGYTALPGYALLAYFVGRTTGKNDSESKTPLNDNDSN